MPEQEANTEQNQGSNQNDVILNNAILDELKKSNKNTDRLISLIEAYQEEQLKDKEQQATKDSEMETKKSETLVVEQKKQEEIRQQEKKQQQDLLKEVQLSNEQLKSLAESTGNSDLLTELKDTNKNVATIVDNQNVSVGHEAEQVSLGNLAVAAIIIAIVGYTLMKLGGFFTNKITRMLW